MKSKIFIIYCILFSLMNSQALSKSYCEEMNLGWHFYCDPKKYEQLEEKQLNNGTVASAKQELEKMQKKLENLKIRAVIYPTKANIYEYIKYQQEQLDKAVYFSRVWQQALQSNPEIDYMVKEPISSVGNQLLHEIRTDELKKRLAKLNERFGLFFVYSTSCPYCLKYSPIIKAFADEYNLTVQAISIDKNTLPEWQDSMIGGQQLKNLGLEGKPVPATLLFDNKTKTIVPIGFGLLTISDLEERIQQVLQNGETHD